MINQFDCGKRGFESRHAADLEVSRLNRHKNGPRMKGVYKCEQCQMWHMTTRPLAPIAKERRSLFGGRGR